MGGFIKKINNNPILNSNITRTRHWNRIPNNGSVKVAGGTARNRLNKTYITREGNSRTYNQLVKDNDTPLGWNNITYLRNTIEQPRKQLIRDMKNLREHYNIIRRRNAARKIQKTYRNYKTRQLLNRLNNNIGLIDNEDRDLEIAMNDIGYIRGNDGYWHSNNRNFNINNNLENTNISAADRRPHVINNYRRRIDYDILRGNAEVIDENDIQEDGRQNWDYIQHDRIVLHNEDQRIANVDEYNRRRMRPYKILINNREIPFDIYKFEGDNKAVRNHYVLYYNRKKSQIGIKYIGDLRHRYIPGFQPDFNKRNIFYLEILEIPAVGFNGYDCKVLNSNNALMSQFNYSVNDAANRSDKYCDVMIQGDDGLDYHRDIRI